MNRRPAVLGLALLASLVVMYPSMSSSSFGQALGGLQMNPAGGIQEEGLSFEAFDFGQTGDRGTAEYHNFTDPNNFHFNAKIQCATVSGNVAKFGFQVPPGTSHPELTGLWLVWWVMDNGSPGKAGSPSNPTGDQIVGEAHLSATTAIPACQSTSPAGLARVITEGNLSVR